MLTNKGFGALIQSMINELKHLEEHRIDISIDGIKKNVKVTNYFS